MLLLRHVFSPPSTRCICRNFAKMHKNPGVERRKNLLAAAGEEEDVDFDDLETDFMDVHKSHKQYMQELEEKKERIKYFIVQQKYFKEKLPNFLTWHDKEQIRYLHRTDPEEWTIERLSEGFPALPEVIKKIVKSNWTKTKQNKITNHDASVQKNWELFKAGKMTDLPENLKNHLNKFTDRTLNLKPFVLSTSNKKSIEVKNKKIGTEFADIIKSYQKLKNPDLQETEKGLNLDIPELKSGDTYLATTVGRSRSLTFDQLQQNLKNRVETGQKVDENELSIVETESHKLKEKGSEETESKLVDLVPNKYENSTGIQYYNKTERDLSHLNYPEQITIPKSIHKKGVLYKLNDCYYDDDGEFLYRVPGMS